MARELSVVIKGELIVFESRHTDEEALEILTSFVNDNIMKSDFAISLVSQTKEKELSEKQMIWVHKLVADFESSIKKKAEKTEKKTKITYDSNWIKLHNGVPPLTVPDGASVKRQSAIKIILQSPEKYLFVPENFEYYLTMIYNHQARRDYLKELLKLRNITHEELMRTLDNIAKFYQKEDELLPNANKCVMRDVLYFTRKL